MLVDIGANLTHQSFEPDLDAVLDRAFGNGVEHIVVTGTCLESSRAAIDLASRFPSKLSATVGIHPHEAESFSEGDLRALAELSALTEVSALGEMGLDYNRNFASRTAQVRAFEGQLQLAADLQRPVFVHERDAAEDMLALLEKYRPMLTAAVVHCFTGEEATLKAYLDLDVHIGITGWICDERRGNHLRDLVGIVPRGRLMLETDSPYLMPRDYPAKKQLHSTRRNEPVTLMHIAETVSNCRGESLEELCEHTAATSRSFFSR
ncbi:MAG: TatD family hydrolase [Pseudomonadales bacterium]